MTKYFMTGTLLEGYEKLMMVPPRYRLNNSTMFAKHNHKAEDIECDCCLDSDKQHKRTCASSSECEFFDERLENGIWTHGELAGRIAAGTEDTKLIRRTKKLIPPKTASPFIDEAHFKRMEHKAGPVDVGPSPYKAAVFLLSGDLELWERSEQAILAMTVVLERINVRGIGMGGYALIQAVKDIADGGNRVTVDDLCDRKTIDDEGFKQIISARVINRYGIAGIEQYQTQAAPQRRHLNFKEDKVNVKL